MQKITPHLWFDRETREAVEFYSQSELAIGQNAAALALLSGLEKDAWAKGFLLIAHQASAAIPDRNALHLIY